MFLHPRHNAPPCPLGYGVALAVELFRRRKGLARRDLLPHCDHRKAALNFHRQYLPICGSVQALPGRWVAHGLGLDGRTLHRKAAAGKVQADPAERLAAAQRLGLSRLQKRFGQVHALVDAAVRQQCAHACVQVSVHRAVIDAPDKAAQKTQQHKKQHRTRRQPGAGVQQPFGAPPGTAPGRDRKRPAAAFCNFFQSAPVRAAGCGGVAVFLPANAPQPYAAGCRAVQKSKRPRPGHGKAEGIRRPKFSLHRVAPPTCCAVPPG